MSNRSAKAISADNRYDNFVKDHVTKHSRRMISFSIRDATVHVNGDKDSLNLLNTFPELSVKDLIFRCHGCHMDIQKDSDSHGL